MIQKEMGREKGRKEKRKEKRKRREREWKEGQRREGTTKGRVKEVGKRKK